MVNPETGSDQITDVTTPLSIPKLPADATAMDAAREYAACGLYIGPVARSDPKSPGAVLGKGWQHKTTRDPMTIFELYAGTSHGVFLHAGRSGLVIIDMDHPEKCPQDVMAALTDSWAPFQRTRLNDSGRGHYIFAMPPGRCIGNSVGIFRDCGFEVRGINGVIIAAPSIHELAHEGGLYAWETTGPIAVLPPLIANGLPDADEATEAVSDAQIKEFLAAHTTATRPAIVHGHLKAFANRMGELGSRHDAMVSPLTGAMKEARAGYYCAQHAYDTLLAPFMAAKTKPFNGKPAMTQAAALADFRGILAWAIGQANAADLDEVHRRVAKEMVPQSLSMTQSEFFTGKADTKADTNGELPCDTPASKWKVVTGGAFIFDRPKNIPSLWGKGNDVLWPDGEGFMIAGPQGLGKTTLMGLLIGAQLGLNDGIVLGLPVPDTGESILVLAMDRPMQIARSLARQFTETTDREVLDTRLFIRPGPPPADLARAPELMAEMAADLGCGVIYIDSLKDAAVGLSDDEIGALYNRARQYVLAAGRNICDAHHVVKRGEGGIDDVYGSTWLTSGCGSVIMLSGEPGDPIIGFRHIKIPAAEVGPYRLSHDQIHGQLTIEHSVDLVDLVRCQWAHGLTAKAAAAVLFDTAKPTRGEIEKARRKLDDLVTEGLLIRQEGTKGGARGQGAASWFMA